MDFYDEVTDYDRWEAQETDYDRWEDNQVFLDGVAEREAEAEEAERFEADRLRREEELERSEPDAWETYGNPNIPDYDDEF